MNDEFMELLVVFVCLFVCFNNYWMFNYPKTWRIDPI